MGLLLLLPSSGLWGMLSPLRWNTEPLGRLSGSNLSLHPNLPCAGLLAALWAPYGWWAISPLITHKPQSVPISPGQRTRRDLVRPAEGATAVGCRLCLSPGFDESHTGGLYTIRHNGVASSLLVLRLVFCRNYRMKLLWCVSQTCPLAQLCTGASHSFYFQLETVCAVLWRD